MLAFNVTDRRSNSGKNLNNRQRFMERVKKKIEHSVTKGLGKRGIEDQGEAEVSISRDGIDEPQFQYDRKKGVWDHLLPGNKHYNVGDGIPRPQEGGGGGGSEASPDGDGEDDFRFYVSYDEYINAIFGDLSLPDMVKESEKQSVNFKYSRAGYTTVGAASNLALERTMIMGIARRLALKTPKLLHIKELEDELEDADEERRIALEEEIVELLGRANAIPFLDKSDLRYRATVKTPQPVSKAVMFCCMDVSGSMTEHMKDLAKRFYILLYIFLKRQYKDVDVVFIRHTHEASEVDEDTFFHSPDTGGTVISTAYDEMANVIAKRYPIRDWNIYCAQASDGDNTSSDNQIAQDKLVAMMPCLQYFTYVEVGRDHQDFPPGFVRRDSDVWVMMNEMLKTYSHKMAIRKITNKGEIVEVFRSLFKKRQEVQ
jgi:uncharacterized sporulation protein YeaH/YhbH (DUF444 family)